MEEKTYLDRYRLCMDRFGIPIVIRQGADEVTLKGEDLESGEQVAIQVQPAMTFSDAEGEHLEREARAARQINHINIPRLRDFGFDEGKLVYVTDHFEGVSADAWLKTNGPMPVASVLRLASQAVSALVAATLHGIIHYAVNPANIVIMPVAAGDWPRIKMLNFLGVAPSLGYLSENGWNAADFTSPEQLHEGPVTFRSEIYSLGCTLWYLLKQEPIKAGAALDDAADVPAPVRQLLVSMVAENPADRPADPQFLQQQIQDCLARLDRRETGATNEKISAPVLANFLERAPRRHSVWKPLALAAILIAIAALTAVVLAQRTHTTVASLAPLLKPRPSPPPPQIVEQTSAPSPVDEPVEQPANLIASASPVALPQMEDANHSLGEAVSSDGGAAALPHDEPVVASLPPEVEPWIEPAPLTPENALAQLPMTPETPPPAEGPGEEIAAPVSLPSAPAPAMVTNAQIKNASVVALPASKSAKPAHPVPAKKSKAAESSDDEDETPPSKPRPRIIVRHQMSRNSVGHVLFPKTTEHSNPPAASPSPR